MRIFRVLVINVLSLCAVFLSIDVVAWNFFKEEASLLFTDYGHFELADRGYPRYHFSKNKKVGFDISPGIKAVASGQPAEVAPYEVWGNKFGCFDDTWDKFPAGRSSDGIYLAGDSFTWGYSRYADKFGTRLQRELEVPVMACGVTHTGQAHQFYKFKALFDQGLRPGTVIVNITDNDIANDFFFPHTTIIDGYMVENIGWCIKSPDTRPEELLLKDVDILHINDDTLRQEMAQLLDRDSTDHLQSLSLSFNVAKGFSRHASNWFRQKFLGQKNRNNPIICPQSLRSVYGKGKYTIGKIVSKQKYADSPFSEGNRDAIARWVQHADVEGYRIVFSFIPEKTTKPDMLRLRSAKADYISSLEAEVWRFGNYIAAHDLTYRSLYYQNDAHLNAEGNARYAMFLQNKLVQERL